MSYSEALAKLTLTNALWLFGTQAATRATIHKPQTNQMAELMRGLPDVCLLMHSFD